MGAMKALRPYLCAIALFTVAAHPVIAMAMPCCCMVPAGVPRVDGERGCCERDRHFPDAALAHACCAKNDPAPTSLRFGGCCCIDAAPPAIPAREIAAPKLWERPIGFVPLIVFDAGALKSCGESRDGISPSRAAQFGTTLLALLCTWLK
jgi:hypothetical protein